MFRNEKGNAAASLVLVILAGIVGGTLAVMAISFVTTTNAAAATTSMENAITARYAEYLDNPANLNEVCYQSGNSCVGVSVTGGYVVLTASYSDGEYVIERERTAAPERTHITGFDNDGNPVWTEVTGRSQF